MNRLYLVLFMVVAAAQMCFAQQARTLIRVGDAFTGPVKGVRTEVVRVRMEAETEIEVLRGIVQVVTYSPDGRTKETVNQAPNGTIQRKLIEKYHPSGNQESLTIYDGNGNEISSTTFEHDDSGAVTLEKSHRADGSVESQTSTQVQRSSAGGMVAVSKVKNGNSVETSYNTQTAAPKVSNWSTTKADGSRQENTFAVDSAGDHNDETITYKPDGSLASRRVSKVNRDVTQLEATEYDANGAVQKRTLETREYDSHRNVKATVSYKWNAALERFEPISRTYNHIEYFE